MGREKQGREGKGREEAEGERGRRKGMGGEREGRG